MSDMDEKTVSAYAICSVREVQNRKAKSFTLMRAMPDGTERPWPIFIIRWDKQIVGYVNNCPHHNVNLDWERNSFLDSIGTKVLCGKHGSLFDIISGDCVEGPCMGKGLERVPLTVLDGDVCIVGVELAEEVEEEDEDDDDDEIDMS